MIHGSRSAAAASRDTAALHLPAANAMATATQAATTAVIESQLPDPSSAFEPPPFMQVKVVVVPSAAFGSTAAISAAARPFLASLATAALACAKLGSI